MRVWMALALVIGCAGCSKPAETSADKVTAVPTDDARMNAAMEKARSTADTFIAALKSPKSTQTAFSVKAPFTDGTNVEYMWLAPVTYDGKSFHGQINNKPEKVHNIKLGQTVTIEPSKIADWMIVDNGALVGGYTTRAVRDSMSPAERAEFDKTLPFTMN